MSTLTAAAREQAVAILLAAVHVCAPGLVEPPATSLADRAPFRSGEELWAWAARDPELSWIRAALDPEVATRARAVADGMVRARRDHAG